MFPTRVALQGGATGVRFAPDSPHVLYTSGYDSRLLVIDTRLPVQQQVRWNKANPCHVVAAFTAATAARVLSAAYGLSAGACRTCTQPYTHTRAHAHRSR